MLVMTGCASIVDGGNRKISVRSEPSDAKVTVYDQKGDELLAQQTPAVFRLQRGNGYFSGATYRLVVQKQGYQTTEIALKSKLNGWYFGNVLVGGLVGMLFVDPMTGAMWTLSPKDVNVALKQQVASFQTEKGGLVVMLRKDVPEELVPRLLPVTGQ